MSIHGNMKVFIVEDEGGRGNVEQIFDFNFSQFLMCEKRREGGMFALIYPSP